jgi:hypothetical protein
MEPGASRSILITLTGLLLLVVATAAGVKLLLDSREAAGALTRADAAATIEASDPSAITPEELEATITAFETAYPDLEGTEAPRATRTPGPKDPRYPPCYGPNLNGCISASKELRERYADPTACDGDGKRVCLVPFGATETALIEGLVAHFKTAYGLDIRVLSPLTMTGYDEPRDQYNADKLRQFMAMQYAQYANDPAVTLIAIVPIDIFLPSAPNWGWAFGQAYGFDRDGR